MSLVFIIYQFIYNPRAKSIKMLIFFENPLIPSSIHIYPIFFFFFFFFFGDVKRKGVGLCPYMGNGRVYPYMGAPQVFGVHKTDHSLLLAPTVSSFEKSLINYVNLLKPSRYYSYGCRLLNVLHIS